MKQKQKPRSGGFAKQTVFVNAKRKGPFCECKRKSQNCERKHEIDMMSDEARGELRRKQLTALYMVGSSLKEEKK